MNALNYNISNEEDNNSLDVLLTRLRKKCQEKTGLKLPITTMRKQGYSWSGKFLLK